MAPVKGHMDLLRLGGVVNHRERQFCRSKRLLPTTTLGRKVILVFEASSVDDQMVSGRFESNTRLIDVVARKVWSS